RVLGSAILDPTLEADDSARSLRVHLPTRDHNWRKHRAGLFDVLATCGRAWPGVTRCQWDGIQEVEGSTPFGSTSPFARPDRDLALAQLNHGVGRFRRRP